MASTNRLQRKWLSGMLRIWSIDVFLGLGSMAYQPLLTATTISLTSPGFSASVTSASHGTNTDLRPPQYRPLTSTPAIQQVPLKCRWNPRPASSAGTSTRARKKTRWAMRSSARRRVSPGTSIPIHRKGYSAAVGIRRTGS